MSISISLTCFNRHFTPSWLMTLLAFVFIVLFVKLGFWQIQRGQEKNKMLVAQASMQRQPAQIWQTETALPKQYQPLIVQGQFLPTLFYLDNQHHDHQFGYHIISPLLLDNNKVLLIDRGWMKGDMNRSKLPAVTIPQGKIRVKGAAWYPSAGMWALGPEIDKRSGNVAVIESVKLDLVSQFLQKTVYPFIIRLDAKAEAGFVRQWPVVAMLPAKHYAYAFQWFAMALVIVILYVALNLKKK